MDSCVYQSMTSTMQMRVLTWLLHRYVHFSPHRLKDRSQGFLLLTRDLPFKLGTIRISLGDGIQINLLCHGLEKCCCHSGKPSRATELEPTQVSTGCRGAKDAVWSLLHFLSW